MRLEVELRDQLFFRIRSAAEGEPDTAALGARIVEIVAAEPAFEPLVNLIAAEPGSWFALDRMARDENFWSTQETLVRSLTASRQTSIDALLPYLPRGGSSPDDASLSVVLTPGFHSCFGPIPGVQIFGLREGSSDEEAFLFLVHVYYHELTSLFASDWSRRSETPASAADLRHWLLMLVQNEGLANYAILEPLLALRDRDPNTTFAYFTYARLIGDAGATATAMQALRTLLAQIDDESWQLLRPHVARFLKEERLPIINLVGIHVAQAIASSLGVERLLERRESEAFFELFAEVDDPLRDFLFGEDGTALDLFRTPQAVSS